MKITHPFKLVFRLWVIQGVAAFVWLLVIPTDTGRGFTAARLLLLGIAFALTALSVVLYCYERLPLHFSFNTDGQLDKFLDVLFLLSFTILIISPLSILVLRSLPEGPQFIAYAERLSPLAMWFTFSAFELFFSIVYLRWKIGTQLLKGLKRFSRTALGIFVSLVLIIIFVYFTKIGITPDYNIGAPAIPLLEWQVFLIIFSLIVFVFIPIQNIEKLDRWLVPIMYILTVMLWLSQPVNTAYAATPPRAPNFEIYPFSDSQIYAQYAQAALVGNGFSYPDVPSRSLYIAFLTWAHLLGNQNYNLVIVVQTLLLAWFPVFLYLIGKELGGKSIGFGLAAMYVFRDINANIAVPFASNVTYSKLLLSEIPLALFLSICIWIIIRWLKYGQSSFYLPLLAGAVLGAAVLIRTQSVALLVVIMLFAFQVIQDKRIWLKGMIVFGLALVITILPWVIRNYMATGGLILDNPISQMMTMVRRWNGNWSNETLPKLDGETDAQYSSRMTQAAIAAFKRDPQFVISTASNHFMNSEIASLMIFPLRDEIRSSSELLVPQHAFWSTSIKPGQIPLFTFYLILFGLGISIAIRRLGWFGLLPLALGTVYNVWTALFFSSGERFIVPLDWTIFFYQMFGLSTIGAILLAFTQIGQKFAHSWINIPVEISQPLVISSAVIKRNWLISIGLVILLAAFTPLTEFIFPQRYTSSFIKELEQKADVQVQDGENVIYGRVLYPRYYESGEGEPETEKLGYRREEKARLVFQVTGSDNALVIFELPEAPLFFPHASDVMLVGDWAEKGYFSPRLVVVFKDNQSMKYQLPKP